LLHFGEVLDLLRQEIECAGSQLAWSRCKDVDRAHLSRVLHGHELPSKKLIHALRLKKVVLPSSRDVLDQLSKEIRAVGSQSEWARRNGLSQTYISQLLIGRRRPGPDVIRALKLERTIAFAQSEDN